MPTEESVFRAIAHPARRSILELLSVSPRSVKELTSEFDMSQPAISQHLKELRDAELVSSERNGLEQRYRLTPTPLRYVVRWADRYKPLVDPAGHLWSFSAASVKPSTKRKSNRSAHGD